jgi:hypothetical protein
LGSEEGNALKIEEDNALERYFGISNWWVACAACNVEFRDINSIIRI